MAASAAPRRCASEAAARAAALPAILPRAERRVISVFIAWLTVKLLLSVPKSCFHSWINYTLNSSPRQTPKFAFDRAAARRRQAWCDRLSFTITREDQERPLTPPRSNARSAAVGEAPVA